MTLADPWRHVIRSMDQQPGLLDCIEQQSTSHVGRQCCWLMAECDRLIARMPDLSRSRVDDIRMAAVDQMIVWYYG